MMILGWDHVVVESPFKGCERYTEAEARDYLEECLLDCVLKGESPYASHKMLTDCLDDSDPGQRKIGINAGLSMARLIIAGGGKPVFYVDLGWSSGMKDAKAIYDQSQIEYEIRRLPKKKTNSD